MNACIVDDERLGREALSNILLSHFPQVQIVGMANGVEQALSVLNSSNVDVLFLDIEMPGENGLELLNHFPNPKFQVVFTTAYEEYAIEAIRKGATDYLLKPIEISKLHDALARVTKRKKGSAQKALPGKISIHSQNEVVFLNPNDILFLRASRAYTDIVTTNEEHVVSKPSKRFEYLLQYSAFMRVHRSYIVNLDWVESYNRAESTIIMSNDASIPLSSSHKKDFFEALSMKDEGQNPSRTFNN